MNDIGRYFGALFELIGRVGRLDRDALAWVDQNPQSLALTIGVAVLAGLSLMIGHAAVLLLNRLTGWRLVAGLVVSALGLVVLFAFESVVLWAIGSLVVGGVPYSAVLSGVLVSTAPQVLGFLVLLPHVGQNIGRALMAWSAICLWAVTITAFDTSPWVSLAIVVVAWLATEGLSLVASPLLTRALSGLLRRITGREFWVSGADILHGRPLVAAEVAP